MSEVHQFPEQWIEITPKGIRSSTRPAAQRVQDFRRRMEQAYYLIRCNLRKRTFSMALGGLWLVFEPILYACLYFFLVTYIFKMTGKDARFMFIFTSVTFWRFHLKLFGNAPAIMTNNAGILKQTNFPLQLVIYEFIGTELFMFFWKLVVLAAFLFLNGAWPKPTWAFVPLIFAVQLTFDLMFIMFFPCIGTFFRDFGRMLFIVSAIWWYMSPGMYGVNRVPESILPYYKLNPFAHILPAYHDSILLGKVPDMMPLGILFVISLTGVVIGSQLLKRARYYFFNYL